jgi:hypothetical protein
VVVFGCEEVAVGTGQKLAYVYFENEARRIRGEYRELPELLLR